MNHIIKQSILAAAAFMLSAMAMACSGTPKFSDVQAKEWKLVEVRSDSENLKYDRNRLEAETFGDIFTMKFEDGRISGKAAPNR
jgi:hypothetical protein